MRKKVLIPLVVVTLLGVGAATVLLSNRNDATPTSTPSTLQGDVGMDSDPNYVNPEDGKPLTPDINAKLIDYSIIAVGPIKGGIDGESDVFWENVPRESSLVAVKWTLTNTTNKPIDKLSIPYYTVVYGENKIEAESETGFDEGGPLRSKDNWTIIAPGATITMWVSYQIPTAEVKTSASLQFDTGQEFPLHSVEGSN